MTFEREQLSAIVVLAIAMSVADGRVAQNEVNAISLELANLNDDPKDAPLVMTLAKTMGQDRALSIIRQMNLNQKKYVTGFLASIMAADGNIDDSEIKMWSLISYLADLPPMTVGEAITFWASR
ncbi:MAG TPA: hypothetical protein DDX40_06870 [Rikenellaceae bacterium]|nr:hypothetical protein [Rikenellaceae bacterium]